jgi:hypothetical protein
MKTPFCGHRITKNKILVRAQISELEIMNPQRTVGQKIQPEIVRVLPGTFSEDPARAGDRWQIDQPMR